MSVQIMGVRFDPVHLEALEFRFGDVVLPQHVLKVVRRCVFVADLHELALGRLCDLVSDVVDDTIDQPRIERRELFAEESFYHLKGIPRLLP